MELLNYRLLIREKVGNVSASTFGKQSGAHGGVWECPDLVKLSVDNSDAKADSKWVLIVNLNPGGPFGGSATQYFVGNWDGTTFTCIDEPAEIKWLDYGKDHYATVTWLNAPDNRTVAIGWMSNWQYATILPTQQFRSQNTIARDLSLYIDDLGEYRVRVMPSPETKALKGSKTKALPETAIIEFKHCGNKPATIILSNDKGEQVSMTLDLAAQTFTMDRTKSGLTDFSADFAAVTTTPLFVKKKAHKITLYIDRCSIEAFDGEGHWAMTNLVFPTTPYNQISVKGGKATIYTVNY
jgi:levanase/fructan beta-fructosidase